MKTTIMRKGTITVETQDCRDCFFNRHHMGHGECWYYCSHPNHNQPSYCDILWGCYGEFESVPNWCPLPLINEETK